MPKYDPKSGKWVVKNWNGTVSGVENGEKRSFESLNDNDNDNVTSGDTTAQATSALSASSTSPMEIDMTTTTTNSIPFAKIDGVSPLSPAHEAGLREGDLIVQFGPTINHSNHDHLRALMPVVATAADTQQAIQIALLRKQDTKTTLVRLGLVPKPWPGRGLIGCHIVPYEP
jgi:26S proteasome regulatory subunit N4